MIVRELTGGVYFGEPKEIVTLENGERRAVDTQVYTTHEIERIAKVAFDLARKRGNKVHSAEKNNVMRTGVLWKQVVTEVHKSYAPDVKLEHILADNCAMQLIRNPKQFDVIVTDNLFGDVLSDEAAMMTGSLGMLPSASLGAPDQKTGRRKALYEPVHGSAPDIAGKGLANPIATIASFAMALRYSFDRTQEADLVDKAIATRPRQGPAHRRHHAVGHAAGRNERNGPCHRGGTQNARGVIVCHSPIRRSADPCRSSIGLARRHAPSSAEFRRAVRAPRLRSATRNRIHNSSAPRERPGSSLPTCRHRRSCTACPR